MFMFMRVQDVSMPLCLCQFSFETGGEIDSMHELSDGLLHEGLQQMTLLQLTSCKAVTVSLIVYLIGTGGDMLRCVVTGYTGSTGH